MVLACSATIEGPYIVGLPLRGRGARKERGHETRGEEKLSVHGAWDYMIQRLMSAHAILCSLADRPGCCRP
jgi:hypothetical protein